MSTTMFGGLQNSLPIFISPAALARLGHPDGEMNLVRAAGSEGILQGVSSPESSRV
jgi:L-lactate dehydrogenase (cytochrome)